MVFSVKTFNNINQINMSWAMLFRLTEISPDNPDAYIPRSQKLAWTVNFPSKPKAIARAGAGTNNIPADQATGSGIVALTHQS